MRGTRGGAGARQNVFALKLQAFVLGGAIGGATGIVFARGVRDPSFFIAQTTNWYLKFVILEVATVDQAPNRAMEMLVK